MSILEYNSSSNNTIYLIEGHLNYEYGIHQLVMKDYIDFILSEDYYDILYYEGSTTNLIGYLISKICEDIKINFLYIITDDIESKYKIQLESRKYTEVISSDTDNEENINNFLDRYNSKKMIDISMYNHEYLMLFENKIQNDKYLNSISPDMVWIADNIGIITYILLRLWANTKFGIVFVDEDINIEDEDDITKYPKPCKLTEQPIILPPFLCNEYTDAKIWPAVISHSTDHDYVFISSRSLEAFQSFTKESF